jgi:5'-nucleotidase
MRPLILLANDDGVAASGLASMRRALAEHADVVVCAPEVNQSATSHALTLHRVLRLRAVEPGMFSVDGTPADCVYVALSSGTRILPRTPDLCVSGLNHGLNLGVDVFYSGTVAAAREAALRGIPSLAVSADARASQDRAAEACARIARAALERGRGGAFLLNVNVPPAGAWPVRATRLGRRTYEGDVVYRVDPRGGEYLWIGGADPRHHDAPGSDTEAYDDGAIGVTPLALDLTDAAANGVAQAIVDGAASRSA